MARGWDVDPPSELEPAAAALLVRSTPDRRDRIELEMPWWITGAVGFVIGVIDPAEGYLRRRLPRGRSRRWGVRRVAGPALGPPRETVEQMIAELEAVSRRAKWGGGWRWARHLLAAPSDVTARIFAMPMGQVIP